MAESDPLLDGLRQAVRIITSHLGMSADSRRQIALAIGDADPNPEAAGPLPPPPDPRDAQLAALQAQIDKLMAAQATPAAPPPQASAGTDPQPAEAPSSEAPAGADNEGGAEPTDAEAVASEEPVNPQVLPG